MPTPNIVSSTPKIAIVTGGSRGLGRNTVMNLAWRGVDSIFTYHSNQAEANSVVAAVGEAGRKAVALQLDTVPWLPLTYSCSRCARRCTS